MSLFSGGDTHIIYIYAASWDRDSSESSGKPKLSPSVLQEANSMSTVISRAAPSGAPSAHCPPPAGQRPNLAIIPAVAGETPAASRNRADFGKEETDTSGWLGHSLWGQVLRNSINSG